MAEPFVGEIRMFAGNFAPRGWAFCDGQLLPIAQNDALFALVGTTYGGDGRTTFGLPDLRGRVPIHAGQGPGLSQRRLGSNGGAEQVTLAAAQMPAHTHALQGVAAPASQNTPGNALFAEPEHDAYARGGDAAPMAGAALGATGGGAAHANEPPTLAVRYIIALLGIFPSRN